MCNPSQSVCPVSPYVKTVELSDLVHLSDKTLSCFNFAFPFITRGVQSFLTHLMPLSFYELAIQTLIIYLLKTILFVFLTWTIFKVFTEFVTIVFLLYVSVSREVSSRTKD